MIESKEDIPLAKVQHSLVSYQLANLRLYNPVLYFPDRPPSEPLKARDCKDFITALREKFENTNVHLKELVLNCYDDQVLEGIKAYSHSQTDFPFHTLTVNLDNVEPNEEFLASFKDMLIHLSTSNVSTLQLVDLKGRLKETQIQELATFIQTHIPRLDITLPSPYQQTQFQRDIDERIITAPLKPTELESKEPVSKPRIVRTRGPRTDKQAVFFDLEIDLQEEKTQQIQASLEAFTDKSQLRLQEFKRSDNEDYGFDDFISHYNTSNDPEFTDYLKQLWLNWFGTLSQHSIKTRSFRISPKACEMLVQHLDKFQYGFDFYAGCPGFKLENSQSSTPSLAYDERYKVTPYNPLQIQLTESPTLLPIPQHLFKAWLDSTANAHPIKQAWLKLEKASYNKVAHLTFKRFLPQLLLLKPEKLYQLFDLSFDQAGQFKAKQFHFLLEHAAKKSAGRFSGRILKNRLKNLFNIADAVIAQNFIETYTETTVKEHLFFRLPEFQPIRPKINHLCQLLPNINLNALLQLYFQKGEEGIKNLIDLSTTYEDLFKTLGPLVFQQLTSYSPLLSAEYLDALVAIGGFTPDERTWWDILLKQHCEAHKNVNLIELVNAFKAFILKLKELSTEDGSKLALPPECHLSGVQSLPIALSRILTFLAHISPKNRKAQLKECSYLDFSSNAVIKLVPQIAGSDIWAFATKEMRVTAKEFSPYRNELHDCYYAFNLWQVIYTESKENVDPTTQKAELLDRFFRFVSYKPKNGQLPLEFYRRTQIALDEKRFTIQTAAKLYALIAASTTNATYVATSTFEESMGYILNCINLIHKPPKPIIMPVETARTAILDALLDLKEIPPLPIFTRLVNLIGNAVNGMKTIIENLKKLKEANSKLKRFVNTYGTSVYDGMKDYTQAEFQSLGLFYKYMDIIQAFDSENLELYGIEQDLKKQFIRLISTFHLEGVSIKKLYTMYIQNCFEKQKELLNLLSQLSTLKLPDELRQLYPKDLEQILKAVDQKRQVHSVAEIIQGIILEGGKLLSDYFPKNVLEDWGKNEVPRSPLEKLRTHFDTQQIEKLTHLIKSLYGHKNGLNAQEIKDCEHLVDSLIAICAPLNHLEKNAFIIKLTSSPNLCPKNPSDADIRYFTALLKCIQTYPSPNEFNQLMASERAFLKKEMKEEKEDLPKPLEQFTQKTWMYLSKILPDLKKIANPAFSQLDLIPRFHKVLLKTPARQLYTHIVEESKNEDDYIQEYRKGFVGVFTKIHALAAENSQCKSLIPELFDDYLSKYSPPDLLMPYLYTFLSTLSETFYNIPEKSLVLALCVEFNKDFAKNLSSVHLMDLLQVANTLDLNLRAPFLRAAVLSAENSRYKPEEFIGLSKLLHEDKHFAAIFPGLYKRAPFPTLEKLFEWQISGADIASEYRNYSLAPCPREEENGFHIPKALEQLNKFSGFEGEIKVQEFGNLTISVRDITTEELLIIYSKYNPKLPTYEHEQAQDLDTLVAVAAELLYRSNGKDLRDEKGKHLPGSSMEINTTQYLALLTSIKTPGHVNSQVGTGEGKSRIMAIYNACMLAQGKTVDLVTSGLVLARRDFVTFQPYYELLNCPVTLVYASMDPSLYKKQGLNISDTTNLSQFRNLARSCGLGQLVVDEVETNRALTLDEADKAYYDLANNLFNVSKEGNEAIQGMEWVYPLLIDYFSEQSILLDDQTRISPTDLYYTDIDLSREKFIQYARAHCSAEQLVRLKILPEDKIEEWQEAAIAAFSLKFKDDFDIQPDTLIQSDQGPLLSSVAQIRFSNRVLKESKYSFGVHQCLHALLNKLRENAVALTDQCLKNALNQCEYPFHISGEKQIAYSSTISDLLAEYEAGIIKAVTGTSGSYIERLEAECFYGVQRPTWEKMHFIDVPRHDEALRNDRAIRLTANDAQFTNAVIEEIQVAISKNQPILLVNSNDQESELLYTKLLKHFPNQIQHIHSQTPEEEEKEKISKAGLPGQITVSTNMVGRGTHIELQGAAKTHGLKVIGTYLPKLRDQEQFFGRARRYGMKGETVLVLNKQKLKMSLNKTTLTDGFYTNREAYVSCEQALMDRESQRKRLLENTLSAFRRTLRTNFYEGLLGKVDPRSHIHLVSLWNSFSEKAVKAWNKVRPNIKAELAKEEINTESVDLLLEGYRTSILRLWDDLRQSVKTSSILDLEGNDSSLYLNEVPDLKLNPLTKKLLTVFTRETCKSDKWSKYDSYDPNHDGRAVKYTHWYIPILASLKGYANLLPYVNFANARKPFANFKAWYEDHGQLFTEFRASINKGKIVCAGLFGLLGLVLGCILTATGVFPLLDFTLGGFSQFLSNFLIHSIGGLVGGSMFGLFVGGIIDYCIKPKKPLGVKLELFVGGSPYSLLPPNQSENKPAPEPAPQTLTWAPQVSQPPNPSVRPDFSKR